MRRIPPSYLAILVAALLGPALMFAAIAWWSWHRVEGEAAATIDRTVALLHEHTTKLFQAERLALARIEDRVSGLDEAAVANLEPELHRFLKSLVTEIEEAEAAFIADPAGELEVMSRGFPVPGRAQPVPTAANVKNRPYFKAAESGTVTIIDGPFRGRVSGREIFNIVRRLQNPDGSFRGVAVLVASPEYLINFWRGVAAPGDSISLVREDGVVFARYPEAPVGPDEAPRRFSDTTIDYMRAAGAGMIAAGPSIIDGVSRTIGFKRIAGYPFFVAYSVDRRRIAHEWHVTLAAFAAISLLAAAGLLLTAFAVIRRAAGETAALARAEAAASALTQSEQRYRALYKKTPVPMQALDVEGRLTAVSDRWLALMGYEREEVIGRPLTDFMTPASAAMFRESAWHLKLQDGELRDAERQYVRKDGEVIDILLSARVERDDDGRLLNGLGVLIDVTQQKRIAAALEQAQKMEAVGQMTGGVAHDFNNLLTIVIGNLELIGSAADDPAKVRRRVAAALAAARRGGVLTQQLLAFARRQILRPETLDPNKVIEEFLPLARQAAGEAVRITTVLSPSAVQCRIDRAQFEAAILNLVVNARDALPNGGDITIETASAEIIGPNAAFPDLLPGGFIVVTVIDTGAGMDAETVKRAFEPFFTTKEVGRGSGLGLSMVYGFVKQSGGHVQIESAPGAGTSVRMYLPSSSEAVHARPAPAPEIAVPANAGSILIVEDNPDVLQVGRSMLEELGFDVSAAANGSEALILLRSEKRFDLLFTDVVMPGMSGDDLAKEAQVIRPGIRVLLTSGYTGQFNAAGPDLEVLPLLAKPYSRSELASKIRDALFAH